MTQCCHVRKREKLTRVQQPNTCIRFAVVVTGGQLSVMTTRRSKMDRTQKKYRTNYDEEVQKYLMHILACLNQIRDELRKINKQEK
jgi:hypothetical protein